MLVKQLVGEQKKKLLGKLVDRFGFPEHIFDEYDFYLGKGEIKICAKGMISKIANVPNIFDAGLIFAKLGVNVKLSTAIVQILGRFATKNIVQMTIEQTIDFISGENVYLESAFDCTNGFVIVRFNEDNLGVGFLRGTELKNLVPGAKRLNIQDAFEQKD